jgi:hypothetical protein
MWMEGVYHTAMPAQRNWCVSAGEEAFVEILAQILGSAGAAGASYNNI